MNQIEIKCIIRMCISRNIRLPPCLVVRAQIRSYGGSYGSHDWDFDVCTKSDLDLNGGYDCFSQTRKRDFYFMFYT